MPALDRALALAQVHTLAAVIAEVDGAVPTGAVFYGGEAASGLHRLFG